MFERLRISLFLMLIVTAGACLHPQRAEAQEAAQEPIAVTPSAANREVRNYRVNVVVKGKMPTPGSDTPADLDLVYSLTIQHKYGRREKDGLLPLEVSVTNADVTVSGQRLAVLPNTFPKLTVLLDGDWRVTDVFGLVGYSNTVPGINYGNLIVLFFLPDGAKPHAIGEKWNSIVKFAPYKETYNIASVLKSTQEIDGVKAVAARQEIAWLPSQQPGRPAATTSAVVESVFAITDGRLLKSDVDCDIVFGTAASAPTRANVKIDIAPIKPTL